VNSRVRIARPEEGPAPEANLGRVLEEVDQMLRLTGRTRHALVSLSLPQEACRIRGNPVHAQQVFLNLISNAADAVANVSTPSIEIGVRHKPDGRIEAWVMNDDGSTARRLTTTGSVGHFMRWTADGKGLFLGARTPSGARIVRLDVASGTMDTLPPISSGAHISLSPRQDRVLDVRNHKTIWVHPLDGAEPYQVFEFPDPDIRIDYPVCSPDGKWVIIDRAAPSGRDIWLLEGLE
jgi:hypothetical protein